MPLSAFATSSKEAKELTAILARLFESSNALLEILDAPSFRADHEDLIPALDKIEQTPFLKREGETYRLRLAALKEISDKRAKEILKDCDHVLELLWAHYKSKETRKKPKTLSELSSELQMPFDRARLCVELLVDESWAWAMNCKTHPAPPEEWYVTPGEAILRHKSVERILTEIDKQLVHIARERFGFPSNPALQPGLGAGGMIRDAFSTAFDTYEIEEQIGEGGSSLVYRVRNGESAVFALKVLKAEVTTPSRMKRFRNEAAFCQRVDHPNILRVVDWGLLQRQNGVSYPFFVAPYYATTLRDLIVDGIPHEEVLPLFAKILNGVEAAHLLNIVHRDIKPENIFYDRSTDSLVVGDFGIAHFSEEELVTAVETKAAERLANFQYAAPEQRVRHGRIGSTTDIYALGLVLNEMFTQEVIQGTGFLKIAQIAPKFEYLDPLVDSMIRQQPSDRPGGIAVIKNELVARGNEFVSRQRLDSLKRTVVREATVRDPLLLDPVRLIGFDYVENRYLVLRLSQPVNERWARCFHEIGNYEFFMGGGPFSFAFRGDEARIGCETRYVQQVIDWFKGFLVRATQDYGRVIEGEKKMEEERSRKDLQRRIAEEEARSNLLKNVRI